MNQRSNFVVSSLACLLVALGTVRAQAVEHSVYVYDVHKIANSEWLPLLNQWRNSGIQRAIVSVETGPNLLLDDAEQSDRLSQLFGLAVQFGIRIEALILQDPSWAVDVQNARRRLRAVIEFERRHEGLIDSVQIDVEVYTPSAPFPQDQAWARLTILVSALREDLRLQRSSLHLNAALPWWLASAVPSYDLEMIYQCLDGIVLMAYGDPGGTPVASDPRSFHAKLEPVIELLPERGPTFRVGVATYEHSSRLALNQFSQQVESLLSHTSGFSGIAYFGEAPRI